jgi:3-deoxy-manno-octulosonate cytidylyltransferase (CMP-KDO synthetase)
MTTVGVIPARHAATRFPGKPLAKIAGVSMIERVWRGAAEAKRLDRILVATDDERIAEACRAFGAEPVLTSTEHATGTDRIGEAVADVKADVVVNVQGDEPLIAGFVIDAAVDALAADPDAPMATVVHPLEPGAFEDPNRVKVVLDRQGRALYFSRSGIPYRRGAATPPLWQHVGLYAYRRDFLYTFVRLPRTPLEDSEQLEQLRALEHGHSIRCAIVEGWVGVAVDVPEDVARVEARLERIG